MSVAFDRSESRRLTSWQVSRRDNPSVPLDSHVTELPVTLPTSSGRA
jgi:hypothetical protein